jgi:CBS domain containing-hemolysin-like protein
MDIFIVMIMLLIFEAFFSGSEIAILAVDKIKVKYMAESGSKRAKLIDNILKTPEKILGTVNIGTNLSIITNTTLATSIILSIFPDKGDLLTTLIMTPIILIFGEIIPKSIAQNKAQYISLKVIPFLWIFYYIFSPIIFLITSIYKFIKKDRDIVPFMTKEELSLLLRTRGRSIDLSEKNMINRIFDFSEKTVKEVMIPLIEVQAISEDAKISNAIDMINNTGFSKFPVYRDRIDNIIGVLKAFDILNESEEEGIKKYIKNAYYVPETKSIDELLVELEKNREGMGVVVDEYGGAVGIITIEDILEEIVGEIEDEYDVKEELYRKIGEKKYIVNVRMEVDKINEILDLNLPKGDYETLGGFILERMGKIPKVGEVLRYNNITFIIKKGTNRFISEVIVKID